ncbi:hypothetical protein P4S72_18635 [Vibrio sp. PP-XX7]
MAKSDELLNALAKAVNAGGGIHSAAELAFMLGVFVIQGSESS